MGVKTRDAHSLPVAGERVGRYEVLAPLASGGMGAVFVARLSGIGGFRKLLALKVLRPELADDPYFVEMFLDECRVVSQISHRNVVQVFDVVMHRGSPCMVMEFLRGRPLSALQRALKADGRPIPDAFAACVLEQAAKGLGAAHALVDAAGDPMQVVHRDISPDNIQVCHDGAVKIVDFGIASTRARSASTRHDAFKGKVAYAAPERIEAPERVDARADAWSLAVVAWELFAGRRLFDADDEAATMWRVIHGEIPALDEIRPDLPRAVTDTIMAALVRPMRDRASDMSAFAAAMSGLAAGAEPELARLVSARFDLDEEHTVLLGTIARELEHASESARPLVRSASARRIRPPVWAWAASAVLALALGAWGLGSLRARAEDPPPVETTPAAVESTAPPTVAGSEPERGPAIEAVPASEPTPPTATSIPAPPAEGAAPESVAPPRTAGDRGTKKRRAPKKREQPSSGVLFNNPYRQ